MIERWLAAVEQGARTHWQLGHEIVLCGRLVKGYGGTNERGKHNLLHVLDQFAADRPGQDSQARTEAIRAARLAALADDAGRELDRTLIKHGAVPLPEKVHPIMWVKKRRSTTA